jgi:Tfp pilus assembly protein PilP
MLKLKPLMTITLSIFAILALSSCGGSSAKEMVDYEDCRDYSKELAELGAAAFSEALKYADQDDAMPFIIKAEQYNELIAENDQKCEEIVK